MEPERGGMNRTERALLGMAVVFTVLSSLFTHLCWELNAAHQLCASVSGCVAMVTGTLCLACLDMWRMGPAGSHTTITLLTQYLRTRAWGYSTHVHWSTRQEQQNQKMVLNTLQRTGLFHRHPSKGIFSRRTLDNLLEDFQQYVPLCEPCLDRGNEDTSECDSEISDSKRGKPLSHHDQFYRYSIGIKREIETLKRVARLRQIDNFNYFPVSKDDSGISFSTTQCEKYQLGNNNINLDYEYKDKFQASAVDDVSLKETYGLMDKDIGHRPFCEPRNQHHDILWLDLKEGEGVLDMMQRQAMLLLLEEDLGILQSPDISTLTNFFLYLEENLTSICRDIRRHCNSTHSKQGLASKRADSTNYKIRNMPKKGLPNDISNNTQYGWPASGALSLDYLRRREVVLRAALEPEMGVSCLASRLWPSLCLISVLRWDPASEKDLLRMRVTTCRLPEVDVSVWLPPRGGVWGQACSGCGVTWPAFRLRAHDGFIEYLDVQNGDVSPREQLELGVHYELVVTTLSGAIRRRTGHIVQVVNIHEKELPCFRIISDFDRSLRKPLDNTERVAYKTKVR